MARVLIGVAIAGGLAALLPPVLGLVWGIPSVGGWSEANPLQGYLILILASLAAGRRMRVPGFNRMVALAPLFLLVALAQLPLGPALAVAVAAAALDFSARRRHASMALVPALFHVAAATMAAASGWRLVHSAWAARGTAAGAAALAAASAALFIANSVSLAALELLARRRKPTPVWQHCELWSLPHYLAAGLAAALLHYADLWWGGHSPFLLAPALLLLDLGWKPGAAPHPTGLSAASSSAEDRADLYLRTLEALALSIESKDMVGRNHLRRLQLYSVEVGRILSLDDEELEALRAAAILHDIGKLAVPEHILSKPGKLTREEFDKVKIHPVVGAEILERVRFPHLVASIVRSHHEKWIGGGYPGGLKGEAIPAGARILAAVDCFDALITGRSYRPAIGLEEAMSRLTAEAGLSFDPKVVKAIEERYRDLEARLSMGRGSISGARTQAPGRMGSGLPAGSVVPLSPDQPPPAFLDTIAAARQEAQILLELTQQLGNSLHLDDTLALVSGTLRRLVPFDSMVIYIVREDKLIPRYATGESTSLFLSREMTPGHGVAGWVAVHKKPVLNGNPNMESGFSAESGRAVVLNSALAVPLPGAQDCAGVLMLCRRTFEGFDKDNLRILLGVAAKMGSVIENAIRFEQATASASTDHLTGLANARALGTRLESELARCRRLGGSLAVLVSDLDGFKEVNDRHGHLEGNAVLRAVAKVLKDNCREYDFVARMGGDEFVLLMPGLEEEDVVAKINVLNRAVAEAGRKVVPTSNLGLSIGQARFPRDGNTADELLAEADQRMYQAKTIRKMRQHRGAPRGYDFDWIETHQE